MMRHAILATTFSRRLRIMTLAGALAAVLAIVAFAPTTAVATHTSTHMRTPFDVGETWKVINGYGQGLCHKRQSGPECGGDEYYALDLVPVNDNAGKKSVYSPVRGIVSAKYDIRGRSAGEGIRIKTEDGGHLVELDHLMNISVSQGEKVTAETRVGQVFDQYGGPDGPNNHLHIQLSNAQRVSQPIKLAGREYYSGPTWNDALIRENVVFANTNFRGRHWWFVEDFSNMRNTPLGQDSVSSLRVNQGCRVTLYEGTNYTGRSKSFTGRTIRNLADYRFNDITSSIRLLCPTGG